jgi:FKBP-type peptidyl-prolyl cis-trans isomerase SlyD
MTRILMALWAGVLAAGPLSAAGQPKAPKIEEGSSVRIEYTIRDEAGTLITSTAQQGPLSYTQGHGQLLPALEAALIGLTAGQRKRVTVPPEDAFGAVDPAAEAEVDKAKLPAEGLKVGATIMAKDPWGQSRPVRVKAIKERTVLLDYNHPLAGKTLIFDVRVLSVQRPAAAKPGR